MKRIIAGIICLIAFAGNTIAMPAQENDPFRSKLPTTVPERGPGGEELPSTGGYGELLAQIGKISLEGIVWSEKFAAAIINGKVYSKGDTIKELDAQIMDISKGKVTISYKDRTYVLLQDAQ